MTPIHNDISSHWCDAVHANNPRSYTPGKTFPVHTTIDYTISRNLQSWDRLMGFAPGLRRSMGYAHLQSWGR